MSPLSPGMGILVNGAKWQATKCSDWPGGATLRQAGTCCLQMSCASQQRVWKRQPLGGFSGRRNVALQDDALAPDPRVGDGDGREQSVRIGVLRVLE